MTDLRQEIDTLLDQINSHELRLEGQRMKLGALLRNAEISGKWKDWGFDRFTLYIAYVGDKINRQKSQVYAILSAATDLLPYMSEEKLEEIGITKAHELRRFVKQSGRRPDVFIDDPDMPTNESGVQWVKTLLEYATQEGVTAAQLRLQINKLLHQEETPQGYWLDLGGCYLTPEEKRLWVRARELGERVSEVDPLASEHEKLKASVLAMAQEAIGSWEPMLAEAA